MIYMPKNWSVVRLCKASGGSLKEVRNWGLGTPVTQKQQKSRGGCQGSRAHFIFDYGTTQTFLYGVTNYLPVEKPRLRDVTPR